ncbi:MAG TPA: hypothetical protein VIT65_12580 [Microlunatus sp.]
MQPWYRWREPLAVVLLVALGLMLVVRVVGLVLAVAAGAAGGLHGFLPGGDDLLLLATAGAVLWCTTPVPGAGPGEEPSAMSPHAWPVAVAGLVVVGLTVLGWLLLSAGNVAALISWPTPDPGFVLLVVEGLLRLALPATALVAVVLSVRRAAAARTPAEAARALPPAEPEVPAVTAAPDRLPAAWQAEEATGAVWLTADDAAQGQPGLSWSDPTATAGAVTSGPWASRPAAAEEPDAHAPQAPPAAAEDDDLR